MHWVGAMPTLEQRVVELERQMTRLLGRKLQPETSQNQPWWKRHSGACENNSLYDEAMRLGSENRRSQPNPADSPEGFTD